MAESDHHNLDELFASLIAYQPDKQSKEIFRELIDLTLEFRDKKKAEDGTIITVEDVKMALTALITHVNNEKYPTNLSDNQNELAKILIDFVILNKYRQ